MNKEHCDFYSIDFIFSYLETFHNAKKDWHFYFSFHKTCYFTMYKAFWVVTVVSQRHKRDLKGGLDPLKHFAYFKDQLPDN